MRVLIYGGGTVSRVRNHLDLCTFSRGTTARKLKQLIPYAEMFLTFMGSETSELVTVDDIYNHIAHELKDPEVKYIIMTAGICDFTGSIGTVESGKYAERLESRAGTQVMALTPANKILDMIKAQRPDIIIVGCKSTTNKTPDEQVARALRMDVPYVLVNDMVTRNVGIVSMKNPPHLFWESREGCLEHLAELINEDRGAVLYKTDKLAVIQIPLFRKVSLSQAVVKAKELYGSLYPDVLEVKGSRWSTTLDGGVVLYLRDSESTVPEEFL